MDGVVKRGLSVLFVATCIHLLASCTKKTPPPPETDAGTPPSTPAAADGREIATQACLSCHQMDMLEQQRLTEAQWTKVVTKMQGWGANLEPKDAPALIAWLSASFGPDAGTWTVRNDRTSELLTSLRPSPDGNYANGKAEHGKALYQERCAGCHGSNAEGHIGVNLVDRPFLYRADDFASTIRRGRGKMPAAKIEDAEVADVLAHLRSLR